MIPSALGTWMLLLNLIIIDVPIGAVLGLVTALIARRGWPYPKRYLWLCAVLGILGFVVGRFASFFGPVEYHVHEIPGGVESIHESIFVPYWPVLAALGSVVVAALGSFVLWRATRQGAGRAAA